LSRALSEQGNQEEAIAIARNYVERHPDDSSSYSYLGNALSGIYSLFMSKDELRMIDRDNLNEAVMAYQKAVELSPDDNISQCFLGISLREQGKLEEAVAAFRQSVQLHRIEAYSYDLLGLTLIEQGKLEEAIAVFQEAMKADPNPGTANNLREAQRLLALRDNPLPTALDNRQYLPSETSEPLVQVLRSTVRIISKVAEGSEIGTGWVVKREGNSVWIVTNRHVVSETESTRPSSEVAVEFFSDLPERPRYTATIEQITLPNDVLDLTVLKVTGIPSDIQPLEIHPGRISRNTPIRVIGHPYTIDAPWNSAGGEIGSYSPSNPIIPVSAYVAVGNSGGPVINEQRQVIAMMVGIREPQDIATKTDQPTPVNEDNIPATGEVGLAYQIDTVVAKLRDWGVLN
jgi:S1-C subfamily serine protease